MGGSTEAVEERTTRTSPTPSPPSSPSPQSNSGLGASQGGKRLSQALSAGVFEGVRPNELSSLQGGLDVRRRRDRIGWRGEVGSVGGVRRLPAQGACAVDPAGHPALHSFA